MLKNVLILVVALATVAAGLFYMASRVGPVATPQAHKIGPTLESHPYPSQPLPNPGSRSVAPVAPAPADGEAPAAAAQAPAAPAPAPVPAMPAPAAAAGVGEAAPARPDATAAPETPGARYPKGYAGCDHYKSYDPATQTFKTLDGRIMPCKVQ